MNRFRLLPACVLALAVVGCDDDGVLGQQVVPLASIHWVNAVPDTGEMDYRVIDIPSNAGMFNAVFRVHEMFPDPIEAGQRTIRGFMSGTDPAISSTIMIDTTLSLSEGTAQSFLHVGFARAGQTPAARVLILPVTPPTLAAGQFAVRVVNAAPSLAGATPTLADTTVASEGFVRPIGSVTTGGTPEISTVAYGDVSAYAVLDTGQYWVGMRPAGGGPTYAQALVPLGSKGTASTNPIAGSRVAGSVLTMVLVPRSVPSSAAPQGGRPGSRETDTTATEAVRRLTRSGDTVTVQVGSISQLVNRPDTVVMDTTIAGGDTSIVADTVSQEDSTVATTGTGGAAGVAAGNVVLVGGATQPEYNGWQVVIAVADSLSCIPVDPSDTGTACAADNAIATTRFRFRYRVSGTPLSPGTGTVTYRIYTSTAADFTLPGAVFLVDRRPPNTAN